MKQSLIERIAKARILTDDLFGLVQHHALYDRPIPERNRIVFYLGHLEAFDWNLIARGALARDSFNEAFDRLFAFGIDPVNGNLPDDQPTDWPALAEVQAYNRKVRQVLDECLSDPRVEDRLRHVAVEHRLMHAETLAYMFHQLPAERKCGPPPTPPVSGPRPTPRRIVIPEGTATMGLSRQNQTFGWDNEFETQAVRVPAFAIDSFNITNGEFLDFVMAGGYGTRSLWSDEAWAWKRDNNIEHPVFWRKQGEQWLFRTMFGEIPLPLDWPVYVSHAEAAAYALSKGLALPTEAQFHRAAFGTPGAGERAFPWGDAAPQDAAGNFDFRQWDPSAVNAHPETASAFGVEGLVGNGWEWTSTVFEPFPGFERFPFYPGYSADFFDGKHYVMKGGSSCTGADLLRRSFRNWFQPHYQYVYATFRCVEN